MGLRELRLEACGRTFAIDCPDEGTAAMVEATFGGLLEGTRPRTSAARRYVIARAAGGGYEVSDGEHSVFVEDEDSLLFHLDKEMILALQYERSDLYFLHAAVVGGSRGVAVLSASSGTGKSTVTLASLGAGLGYLSDELAPIDLKDRTVEAYPRALYLKGRPPRPYALPAGTIEHGGRFHVPVTALGGKSPSGPFPLAAFIFLDRVDGASTGLQPITRASAVTRLMANTLNSLAHPNAGFDAAMHLAQAVPCFELDISHLGKAAAAIRTYLPSVEAKFKRELTNA